MKYTLFDTVVWFDFDGPEYLIGASCLREIVDTKYMFFRFYLN